MSRIRRIVIIDEIRGFLVISMMMYHFMYSFQYIFAINPEVDFFEFAITKWIQIAISTSFIFISGFSSCKSKNILKRGWRLMLVAVAISLTTYAVLPGEFIAFGILHFLAACMILYGITKSIFGHDIINKNKNPLIITVICAFLLIICYNIQSGYIGIQGVFEVEIPKLFYMNTLTSIIGFPNTSFVSADYFPLIPFGFAFTGGVFFESYFKKIKLPENAYEEHSKTLNFIGIHSFAFYILHQPVILAVLFLYTSIV
ncbi:MAG: heparan-alpha-glucosaminide N-acetyltransferase domain-containing protein [Proteocatella sp.]